jgi:hypothetical protein
MSNWVMVVVFTLRWLLAWQALCANKAANKGKA